MLSRGKCGSEESMLSVISGGDKIDAAVAMRCCPCCGNGVRMVRWGAPRNIVDAFGRET